MIQTATSSGPRIAIAPIEASGGSVVVGQGRTGWGAIVAGAVGAIGIQALLTVLGAAIGLSVGAATEGTEGAGLGAAIWWFVTGLLALFIGGWVAGWLSPALRRFDAALHGFLVWCLVTLLSALLVISVGTVATGSLAVIGQQILQQQDDNAVSEQANTRPESVLTDPGTTSSLANVIDDEATANAAGTTWWTFIALVLGAAAASGGAFVAHDMCRRADTADADLELRVNRSSSMSREPI